MAAIDELLKRVADADLRRELTDAVAEVRRTKDYGLVSAHRIGYRRDADTWESLQVDFLVVSRRGDGTLGVSIVDPHGDFLADAKAKLSGLARFAEEFGDRFVRIESIVELPDGTMRLLDLQAETVRDAIDAYEESHVRALYESDIATTYA
jgi:hypothetical protein